MSRVALLPLLCALGCAAWPEGQDARPSAAPRETASPADDAPRRPPPVGPIATAPQPPPTASAPPTLSGHDDVIVALEGMHQILAAPRWGADLIGIFRAGQALSTGPERIDAPGCRGGFQAVAPRGYVCVREGMTTDPTHLGAAAARQVLPRDQPLPFDYGVARGGARYRRLPGPPAAGDDDPLLSFFTTREGPRHASPGAYPGMKLAFSTRFAASGKRWLVTPDLLLVPADEVEPAAPPRVSTRIDLAIHPLPFVVSIGPARRYTIEAGRPVAGDPVGDGVVVPVTGEPQWIGGKSLWPTAEGDHVGGSLARFRARSRPRHAGPDDKWVHASVNGGSLVAYEGDRPVFAALMSPGLGGTHPDHALRTPPGIFRVNAKWRTSDMGGPLPGGGSWRTREVPWVAYYDGSYAIHGVWWHDRFGHPRSHGCLNLAPADAQWLFGWLEPALPEGWYAVRADAELPGTLIWVTP